MRSDSQNEKYDSCSTELLAQKANRSFEEGRYTDSAHLYEIILSRIQPNPDRDKREEFIRYSNMCGMALRKAGCPDRAIPHYINAIEMSNRNITYLNNMAIVYMELGLFSESTRLFHEIFESSEGNMDYPLYKVNYATLLVYRGEYNVAAHLFRKSILRYRQDPSSNAEDQANAYFRLGCLLTKLGHYEAALVFLKEALQSKASIWGNMHPRVAEITRVIAEIHLDLGNLSEARAYAQKALDLYKNKIDEGAPENGRALQIIGSVLCRSGKEGAYAYFKMAERIFKKAYLSCKNHPDIARSQFFWGEYYGRNGDYHKAISHFKNAERIYKKCYKQPRIVYQAEIYNNLGYYLLQIGENRKAWRYFRKSRHLFYQINRHHVLLNLLFANMKDALYRNGHNKLARHIPEHITTREDLPLIPKQIFTKVKTVQPEIHVVLAATSDQEKLLQKLREHFRKMRKYFEYECPRVSFSVHKNETQAFEETNEEHYYKTIFVALHGRELGAPKCNYRTITKQSWIVDYRDRSLFELITILNLHKCDLAVVYSFEKNIRSLSDLYRKEWNKLPCKPVYFKSCHEKDCFNQVVNDINRHILLYVERFNEDFSPNRS
jgi:tetratricopeptide (TPR) repeat protein